MYVIATDPETITMIQGFRFSFQKLGSFHSRKEMTGESRPSVEERQKKKKNAAWAGLG